MNGFSHHQLDPLAASLSGADLPPAHESMLLLSRAQRGEQEALHDLIVRYQERLRRIVQIRLQGSSLRFHYDPMDFVQETFLAVLPHIGTFEPRTPGGLLDWMATIAINRFHDARDYQFAAKRDARRNLHMPSTSGELFLPDRAVDPGAAAVLAEITARLDAAVRELPEDQRRVVDLRDYCGEEWEDIAVKMNRTNDAVRQLRNRAMIVVRAALRDLMDPGRAAGDAESGKGGGARG